MSKRDTNLFARFSIRAKDKTDQLADLIGGEGEDDLVVFLNFFELVAYLQKCGNVSRNDVEAILGYYLRLMRDEPAIRAYVADNTKSFEHLDRLLDSMK